ncbi:MAG: hypothetical protein MUF18_05045 [Fimbriiglobus sp.]|nr:hypothetical protein [Fimbriiglobus sp.]
MSALLFPSADALRLALASGVIPPVIARGPVAAGAGDSGELWLTPARPASAELLAALARIGVRSHAPPPGFIPSPFPCWAAPLPLRVDPTPPVGPLLVRLPSDRLAEFVAAAARLHPQPVRFLPDRPRALALLSHLPAHLLDQPGVVAYHEEAAGVWVRHGWSHPLPGSLSVHEGHFAFVDPPNEWSVIAAPVFLEPAEVFPLTHPQPGFRAALVDAPAVRVPVKLRKHPADVPESLWAFDGSPEDLAELFRGTDERVLSRFGFAVTEADGVRRLWAKPASRGKVPLLPGPFRGFVPHPLLGGLFLPAGEILTPMPRPDRLAELLNLTPRQWVCVEGRNGSPVVHRLPPAAFRPLAELVEYAAPRACPLATWHIGDSPLSFAEVRAIDLPPPPPPPPALPIGPPPALPAAISTSWIARLADRLLGGKKPEPVKPVRKGERKSSRVITPAARTTPDRDTRRRRLEQAVVEKPSASLWAELAAATSDTGKPADAALCWVNALWDRDPPNPDWLAEWVRAERHPKPGPRLAAALIADIGFAPDPHPEVERLPELLRTLDAHEDELPLRAVWLARLAAARAVGGDPLALARCRDRLLARLSTDGPSLDLDAPAFLRFHGALDGDRFRAARDWLLHAREPMHKWLFRLPTGVRLPAAGLDPDPRPTAAYADLMLAWGLSRLGERTAADDLAAQAERTLTRVGRSESGVHAALLARFQARIRDARHGRGQQPHDGESAAHREDDDGGYATLKLCERSRILSPHPAGNPYAGHDLAPLLGHDTLAHRLDRLARHPDPHPVVALLTEAAADPTAATLPRVLLIAAELPVQYPHRTADRLMILLPRAIELLPEAVRLAFDPHTEPSAYLQRLTERLVLAACRLALRYDLNGGFGAFTRFLLDRFTDPVVKAATSAQLPELFATLRKLGLTELAGELAGATADRPIGWFVMGRDEAGWVLLDAARDRLFVAGIPDERERTAAAFEYVAALAHAPPRLALGRLEELFQRLGRVTTAGGTARYFALTPLELIDRAISAVVTDEFNLGPAVRRWLDADEFAIRRKIAADLEAAIGAG